MPVATERMHEIRRANLRKLMGQLGGPTMLSLKLGHSNGSYLAQLAGPNPNRTISEKVARTIEAKLEIEQGWLDRESHDPPPPPLDQALLTAAMQAVQGAATDSNLYLQPAKFAEIVALVYESAQRSGAVDTVLVHRLLRLLK